MPALNLYRRAQPRHSQRGKYSLQLEPLERREVLSSANQRFLTEVYQELFRRTIDQPGLTGWGGLLDQGQPHAEIVRGITASREYQQQAVQESYQALLRRSAEPAGLEAHVRHLQDGGTLEEIYTNLLGSAEYFQRRGNNDNARFLSALYQDALGREVDAEGARVFNDQLAQGVPRGAVAGSVVHSAEGIEHRVQSLYHRFLYRDPEAAGLADWAGRLQAGARHEDVVAGIMGSEEYDLLSARMDVVLDWNRTVLNAIRGNRAAPPTAARGMAMVHAAIYDAVNAIARTHEVYKIDVAARPGASMEAAAAVAAYGVLAGLYPAQVGLFDAELSLSLSYVPDGIAKVDGILVGRTVADGILALRAGDGANRSVPYTPGSNPGDWTPTPPGFLPALLPQWPQVTPFTMTGPTQFRPPAPPALTSAEYAASFNDVKSLGRTDSTTRTAEQTEIALFWADGPGTVTPPGHWNLIARHRAQLDGNTLAENARLFALLNFAVADAAIVSWDCKYAFDLWRPVTAIQRADIDGNDLTAPDTGWLPLIVTPPFPTYTSGHSTFSSAAGEVLTRLLGDAVRFVDASDDLPGVFRTFASFTAAANEAGRSRIYGGIHYEFDNEAGLATGRALASYIVENFLRPRT